MNKSPLKYRPFGVHVTDLTDQLWCEKQLEFKLIFGKEETEEMTKGKDRHRILQEELVSLTKVTPRSLADSVALKLHNLSIGLEQLQTIGITRELLLWGKINQVPVVGSVDELRLESGNVIFEDTKTRKTNRPPRDAQKRTTRFQLMLYKYLFDSLREGQFTGKNLLKLYGLTSKSNITKEFEKEMSVLSKLLEPNVLKLSEDVFDIFRALPKSSEHFEVRYEYQETGEFISVDTFEFDETEFKRNCGFVEDFWLGKRDAMPVGERNRWKCNFCEFKKRCPAFNI